jgi:hypothetical protein
MKDAVPFVGKRASVFQQKASGFPVRIVVFATLASLLAGYGVYTVRLSWARPASDSSFVGLQLSNVTAKGDSLAALIRSAVTIPEGRRYALAAATTGADLDRLYDMVTAAAPMNAAEPAAGGEPPAAPATWTAEHTTASLHAEKPKTLPPPPAPMGLLDDGQIAGIKSRLRLTPEQTVHWPAVETALRAVAKVHLREMRRHRSPNGKTNIDVNSPEVQQLIWAAMPLLGQLREDQKREVRKLVRVIGLEEVASRI